MITAASTITLRRLPWINFGYGPRVPALVSGPPLLLERFVTHRGFSCEKIELRLPGDDIGRERLLLKISNRACHLHRGRET